MDPRSGALDALHHHHSLISDHTQQPHSQQPHLLPHPPSNHSALYRLPAHHYPRPQPISTTHPYSFPPSGPPSVPQLSAYLRGQQPLNPRQLAARSSISHPGYHPHHPLAAHRLSTTCIPSLIPPGMDPGQVDMRTFFPYQPNEVKHRKRTTRSQLKVLEDVYKYDTKPNASLRKKLAEELGMTPRGVQVTFPTPSFSPLFLIATFIVFLPCVSVRSGSKIGLCPLLYRTVPLTDYTVSVVVGPFPAPS